MSPPDLTRIQQAIEAVDTIERCDCGTPSPSDFQLFEMRTGVPIPEEVRAWLSLCNGAYLDEVHFLGLCASVPNLDIAELYTHQRGWLKRRWLPVGGDGCGNYYIVPTQREYGTGYPVVFVEAVVDPNAPSYIVASCINAFVLFALQRECGEERWPFDRDYVAGTDPDIMGFSGLPMPWENE